METGARSAAVTVAYHRQVPGLELAGIRISYCGALTTVKCAAFFEESRTGCASATNLNRKSGVQRLVGPLLSCGSAGWGCAVLLHVFLSPLLVLGKFLLLTVVQERLDLAA
jgi:hypothetical protein